ncbi:16S rRNA (guanine(527)-N(7))-methyltransferase RsmG [Ramlibacter tataouinensis]|uniref:16S rRNA (guanine(527)-N(7))-methyltransferase RsmG n=1 Tax=Ramlibacter tataouinensis TaxID=94132 RepID=UPI0022F3CC7B|nr:16S rRNA (guanine(527)-N(7))-methyltransferase RsmG [Ramlibacter tataouinensis]WBY00017.1 16S rRNA (guanine(527)-N(7))-methyltransferase RsmG [Ramlibacter tataouinensis]
MSLRAELEAGLAGLDLSLRPEQQDALLGYLDLLAKWNKVYNLTAVRDPREMLTHHLLDSLAVVGPLRRQAGEAGRLLDVGAGAGLPGVVIAICCPGWRVDCVDAVGKKAAFVQQAAAALKLPNLRGVHARVETVADRYDLVSARAFASLADFTAGSRQALAEQGAWLAMKGKYPQEEIAALPPDVVVFHVEHLTVPGLAAERCIVWLRPVPPGG